MEWRRINVVWNEKYSINEVVYMKKGENIWNFGGKF